MVSKGKSQKTWYLLLVGVVALSLVIIVEVLEPSGTPLNWAIRGAAMLGYLSVFLASLSSIYVRELVKFFGRPFIKVHHIVSVAGLILLTLHPLGFAWDSKSMAVFIPATDSWLSFFQWGGRPAWYLLGIAALAAVLRKGLVRSWRVIHYLNYLAFALGTVHAILLGTNFQNLVARVVLILMVLVIAAVFVRRRMPARKAPSKR